ncbi:MAG TPA: endolytic transglycosylase MltG [Candidatus Saccharimonadales bacterium]|nr:endolytic transglycosylase MltG [Candidatus Saccharimonadales bacterium]
MQSTWIKRSKVFSKRRLFLIFLFLFLVILLGWATFWVKSTFAAAGTSGKTQVFVIKEGESTLSIANRLKEAGLIKDVTAFRAFVRFSCQGMTFSNPTTFFKSYPQKDCLAGNIQAGSYKLSPNMDLPTLSKNLTKGRLDSWTRITEGLRNEEIAAILAKNYKISEADFLKVAQEGYMFPDTYLFKVDTNTAEVVAKMKANFDSKFTTDLVEKAKAQGLSSEEAVILASVVQREAGKKEDMPTIASIFLNRLKIGMPLGSDVTVQYALGYDSEGKTWWKKDLTADDLVVSSPYNTRVHGGLPPGPISNPGLAALKSVAEPATTDYLYFLYDKDGNGHFAKTLSEHNSNKALYLQ